MLEKIKSFFTKKQSIQKVDTKSNVSSKYVSNSDKRNKSQKHDLDIDSETVDNVIKASVDVWDSYAAAKSVDSSSHNANHSHSSYSSYSSHDYGSSHSSSSSHSHSSHDYSSSSDSGSSSSYD
jgi:hypothetical protein